MENCPRVPGLDLSQVPRVSEDDSSHKAPVAGLRVLSSSPQVTRVSGDRRPLQPRVLPQNGTNDAESMAPGNSTGSEPVQKYAPWVPVRKCAGSRPAPRVTRVEHRGHRQTAPASSSSLGVVGGTVNAVSNGSGASAALQPKASSLAPTSASISSISSSTMKSVSSTGSAYAAGAAGGNIADTQPEKRASSQPPVFQSKATKACKNDDDISTCSSSENSSNNSSPVGSQVSTAARSLTPPRSAPAATPVTVTKAATRGVAALDLATKDTQPAQLSLPTVTAKTMKMRHATGTRLMTPPLQSSLPKTECQPQPPAMPPPRPTPRARRRRARVIEAGEQAVARVLRRGPGFGGVKSIQRRSSFPADAPDLSMSMSLSCIEQLEDVPSSCSEDEAISRGLQSAGAGPAAAMRATSAPALLVGGCLKGSRRGRDADARQERHVSWRTPEKSIIAVSPRSACQQARWASSLALNASLLSCDEEDDRAVPPAAPPPPLTCDGENEVDVLKAALEVSLSLVPPEAAGEDEAIDIDEDDEDEASEIWLGCRGPAHSGTSCQFEGDENDPGAANRTRATVGIAWAPKKQTSSASDLGATWRTPSRSRLSIPLSFREA